MQNSKEKTLSQRIAERIIKYILEENLQPGDKLPNETVMCERLNVGRSSLREAMRALASRNVITIRQGSGSYVSATPGMIDDPFGLTFVEDKQKMIKDLMEIRFLIEPSIAAMAAIVQMRQISKTYLLHVKMPKSSFLQIKITLKRI